MGCGGGSAKSLLIFSRNLRGGVPTQHHLNFPHIGVGTLYLEIYLEILDPSGRVLRRVSLGCILGESGWLVNRYLRIFLVIFIRECLGGCLPLFVSLFYPYLFFSPNLFPLCSLIISLSISLSILYRYSYPSSSLFPFFSFLF